LVPLVSAGLAGVWLSNLAIIKIRALEENEQAARDIQSYLRITVPFGGVISERNVDKRSLVGPSPGASSEVISREIVSNHTGRALFDANRKRGMTH
jgi:hypothetical protein